MIGLEEIGIKGSNDPFGCNECAMCGEESEELAGMDSSFMAGLLKSMELSELAALSIEIMETVLCAPDAIAKEHGDMFDPVGTHMMAVALYLCGEMDDAIDNAFNKAMSTA